MIIFIDGSNVLGRLGLDRLSADSKRSLIRGAAELARRRKARVVCVFDGAPDEAFATTLGSVSVRFAAPRDADSVITAEVERETRDRIAVITSDAELARKVRRRGVEILNPQVMRELMEARAEARSGEPREDWETYFSDPKNRNV